MLDTGAAVTLVRKDLWDEISASGTSLTPWTGRQLVGVEGSPIRVHGEAEISVSFGGQPVSVNLVVADSLKARAILGLDFLEANHCTIDTGGRTLRLGKQSGLSVKLESSAPPPAVKSVNLIVQETLRVPACSETEVMTRTEHG